MWNKCGLQECAGECFENVSLYKACNGLGTEV